MNTERAIFAAGCFWGVEDTFRQVPGVIGAVSGYTGGHVDHPTYEQVCSHKTGHAEAVEVTYDPEQVTYQQLLDVFWDSHDPTQVDRQGPDIGDNYRSEIFTTSPEQATVADAAKAKLDSQQRFKKPIATKISPASTFWPAEEYHQHYYEKHGLTSCHI